MKPRMMSMTAGLAVGITVAVVLATALGTFLYSTHHLETLLDSARASALAQGHLMRAALEHQMMENDRSLIERMVQGFGAEPGVERVMILDRQGVARHVSAPPASPADLRLSSPTCQACHRLPPEQRSNSQVIDTGAGAILRTVVPLENRQACHTCHDPSHAINGILIVDVDAGSIRTAMNRDLRWLSLGSGALALLLVLAIVLVVRLLILRRLQRFETTARQIAAGDLDRRVPVEGSDTVAWLGREFNSMADSLSRLLSRVRAESEQLEAVINGIQDGIVVLDGDRRVLAANDAFLRRTGHVRGALLGAACHDMVRCGTGDCPTQACLRSGDAQVRICERRLDDGSVIWEEVHASPIERADGTPQVVEVWRDISKRRAAEAHLAESHRLASLGLLASGFSHELNTPLATILTCVDGMLRVAQSPGNLEDPRWQRVAESASIAREQLLRCRGITRHFLGLSRGQRSAPELVSLADAVAAVVRLVRPTARSAGVEIELGRVPESARVEINDAELQHAIMNLLLNAIQACGEGGRVRIEVDDDDPVRLRVADDGPGISEQDRQRIFEPFVSGRPGGTGLGLFLAMEFVRRWGGDIRVTSRPGEGATFEVVLPPAAATGPPLRIAQ